jgi:N-acetylmuramoyl-L-alanine amidase
MLSFLVCINLGIYVQTTKRIIKLEERLVKLYKRLKIWSLFILLTICVSLIGDSDTIMASNAGKSSKGFSYADINLMAHAIYGEARGEPFIGQVAIAAVILNRVRNPRFPHTVSGVIYQPGAFTAVSDGQFNLTPNEEARKAAMDAINGWDPTHGALYYFNPATATSKWIWSRPQLLRIGKHIFCE